jgi:Tol biopolymer transport system component
MADGVLSRVRVCASVVTQSISEGETSLLSRILMVGATGALVTALSAGTAMSANAAAPEESPAWLANHSGPQRAVAASSKKRSATLRIVAKGRGSYTVKGKGFRKSFEGSRTLRVRPGRYEVEPDPNTGTYGESDWPVVRAGERERVVLRLVSATRLSESPQGVPANHSSYSPAWSPDGNRIAFLSPASNLLPGGTASGSFGEWFLRDLRSGQLMRINNGIDGPPDGTPLSGASWSPDGVRIAFALVRYGGVYPDARFFVRDLNTGVLQAISTGGRWVNSVSWSPDGARIAFVSDAADHVVNDTNETYDVFVADLRDGSTQRVSTSSAGVQGDASSGISEWQSNDENRLSWSPDGSQLAFVSAARNLVPGDRNDGSQIYMKNIETGVLERLDTSIRGMGGDNSAWMPAWSPDGKSIAFVAQTSDTNDGDYSIYVQNLATGKTKLLSTTGTNNYGYPVWSPDSRRIAFVHATAGQVIVDVKTKRAWHFPSDPSTVDGYASWSPDGKQLAMAVSVRMKGNSAYRDIVVTSDFLKMPK